MPENNEFAADDMRQMIENIGLTAEISTIFYISCLKAGATVADAKALTGL